MYNAFCWGEIVTAIIRDTMKDGSSMSRLKISVLLDKTNTTLVNIHNKCNTIF